MKKYLILLIAAITMVSCTKQEVYERQVTNTLVIYLNSQTITRSALTVDPKNIENTVNSVTIAVFKADGTLRTLKEFNSLSKSVTMRVANLSTSDKVVCVANAKSGEFASVKTLDEFNAKKHPQRTRKNARH